MVISKQVPLTEKSHIERGGVQCPSKTPMAATKLIWHQITIAQRNHL